MADLQLTRSLFLKCLATVYLVAFLSLYTQIPGEGQKSVTKCYVP